MTDSEFERLVARLEVEAAAHPRRYAARVVVLTLLPYAYLALLVCALLGVAGALAWLLTVSKTAHPQIAGAMGAVLLTAWLILRQTWVPLPPPQGLPLRRDDAPRLFALAEEVRAALRAPRPAVILLTDEHNASVMEVPRLGIFGWPRCYLVVGAQLLATVDVEQLRAVLAHEFAHLSGRHNAISGWIYRTRATAHQLTSVLGERDALIRLLVGRFLTWYAPFYNAYTFVLARRHEFEADRLAASVAGARTMAQTLLALRIHERCLDAIVWPALWKRTAAEETPPADPFGQLGHADTAELVSADTARGWAREALAARTQELDTHPALADRLAALVGPVDETLTPRDGAPLEIPRGFGRAHLEVLDGARERLLGQLGAVWRDAVAATWRERHEELRLAREGLAALGAAPGPRHAEARWNEAWWTELLHGTEAAFPLYQALAADEPAHASARFALGRCLLERRDEAGVAHIEFVVEQDPGAAEPGFDLIHRFLVEAGRSEEAAAFRQRALAHLARLHALRQERDLLSPRDTLEASTLDEAAVQGLFDQLAAQPHIAWGWLARKRLANAPDEVLHVLVVACATWWPMRTSRKQRKLLEAAVARLDCPPGTNVYVVTDDDILLRGLMRRTRRATVYRRRRWLRAMRDRDARPTPIGAPESASVAA